LLVEGAAVNVGGLAGNKVTVAAELNRAGKARTRAPSRKDNQGEPGRIEASLQHEAAASLSVVTI